MKIGFLVISLASMVKLGDANLNILTPFGRCRQVPHVKHFVSSELEGVWFLQLTPEISEYNSPYSCQTSFEYVLSERSDNLQTTDVTLSVNIFYASNAKTVREPLYLEFRWDPLEHVFKTETNIDGNNVMLYQYFLNMGTYERISYMCTDSKDADADRTAVYLWSRLDNPQQSVLDEAISNITSIFYPEPKTNHFSKDIKSKKRFLMKRINQLAEECDIRPFYIDGSRYLKELHLKLYKS